MEIQTAADLPLKCGKCGRSDGIEINSEEIHCRHCGNYTFVGRPARWPFVKFVKKDSEYAQNYAGANVNPANISDEKVQSPMQVGENITDNIKESCKHPEPAKKISKKEQEIKEEKVMATCKTEGCDKWATIHGLCNKHFHDKYGISAKKYNDNKEFKGEPVERVIERIREKSLQESEKRVEKARNEFYDAMECEKEKQAETKAPVNETKAPADETVEIVVTMSQERYEEFKAWAEKNYRTPELQAAYVLNQVFRGAEKAV